MFFIRRPTPEAIARFLAESCHAPLSYGEPGILEHGKRGRIRRLDDESGTIGHGARDLDNARTAGFTVLVFAQLFNCFNARSETTSAFKRLFVNPWLWSAIGVSVLLQVAVVHVDVLNLAFGTRPLTFGQWLTCAAMASLVLWFSELRKLFSRASNRQDAAAAST